MWWPFGDVVAHPEMWWLIRRCGGSLVALQTTAHPEMWWLIRRCGGSLVALQTTEALVPGSNTASLTLEKL